MRVGFESKGSFDNTERFLNTMSKKDIFSTLERFGQMGVDALRNATPVRTGLTAASWTYTVERKRGSYSIVWRNTNVVAGVPVAILLQYGHGTGTGGYVQGHDFINPAIKPIFDYIAEELWRVVTSA